MRILSFIILFALIPVLGSAKESRNCIRMSEALEGSYQAEIIFENSSQFFVYEYEKVNDFSFSHRIATMDNQTLNLSVKVDLETRASSCFIVSSFPDGSVTEFKVNAIQTDIHVKEVIEALLYDDRGTRLILRNPEYLIEI
ncbi:MAG: hypothetical protein AB8E15_07375 [Bdellovibrionales bacterium]